MKKVKEANHSVTERVGPTGGNFYHGNDLGTHTKGSLGTRGGDSNFSRRMQALYPTDYFDAANEAEAEAKAEAELEEEDVDKISEIVDPRQQSKETHPFAMGGPERKGAHKLPWVFGPEGYIKRPELSNQYEKKEDIGADSTPEVMVARALAYRASELTNYKKEFDDEIFSGYAMSIYKDYVMGKAGDRSQALDAMLDRIDDGGWDDEEIMDYAMGHNRWKMTENYIVRNSGYSLVVSLTTINEAPTLEMMPDPDKANIFTPILDNPEALATTKRAASYYGLEIGFEGIEALTKYLPGLSTGIDYTSILFNLYTLKKSADKMFELDEKITNELANLSIQMMSQDEAKYTTLFTDGISEIEKLQASMYDDFGDLFQGVFSILPWEEALGLGAGGAGAAATGPGGLVSGTTAYTIAKVIDGVLDIGLGVVIEKAVRSFVENYESSGSEITFDQNNFDDWLRRNEDEATSSMKMILTVLKILEGPFPKFINLNPARALRACFVGATIQNKLIKLIKQLRNPQLIPDEPQAAPGIERFAAAEAPPEVAEPDKGNWLRKLFVSTPLDEGLFEESLFSRSLLYLIEEEHVDERVLGVKTRLRGDGDPKGFSSGIYEDNLDDDEEDEDITEFSGAGAVGGVAMKMGHEADGSRTTQSVLKKRYNYFDKTYGRGKK